MSTENFFQEQTDNSRAKSAIVTKYFSAWATVMVSSAKRYGTKKLCYIDLFSGPGHYIDGSESTPVTVAKLVLKNSEFSDFIKLIFNDANQEFIENLKKTILSLDGIKHLRYSPSFWNEETSDKIAEEFSAITIAPSLVFIDPWGYKGLSLNLIKSTIKDWGCDVIIFFNYNRINMGMSNEKVNPLTAKLFGEHRAEEVRTKIEYCKTSIERELTLVNEFTRTLIEVTGSHYVLPFRFLEATRDRTSHYLFFISKHERGYSIMKEIMAKQGVSDIDGVPQFEYSVAPPEQQLLFDYCRPIEELRELLLDQFNGQTLTVAEIFRVHNVGTPFVLKNYKKVLSDMEKDGTILVTTDKNATRKKGTFADHLIVEFPESPVG